MTFVRTRRFYQHDHLITELDGQTARSVFRHKHGLLAQGTFADLHSSTLMAVSDTDSVMAEYNQDGVGQRTYDPYGLYPVAQDTSQAPLAFNGQRLDLIAEGYLLGNGYRLFSPALRRFCSPDSLSPFGRGGLNNYVYCAGDPLNRTDPSGHFLLPRRQLKIASAAMMGVGFLTLFGATVAYSSDSKSAAKILLGVGLGLMGVGGLIHPKALGRYLTGSRIPEPPVRNRLLSLIQDAQTAAGHSSQPAQVARFDSLPDYETAIAPPSYLAAKALKELHNSRSHNVADFGSAYELQVFGTSVQASSSDVRRGSF
ncbi:RHS repeat-associated core domain-containing protein [Pseudomonas sp. MLB6B]